MQRGTTAITTITPGLLPFNDLCGEAPPERGICFRLQVYERVGISFLEVYGNDREIFHFGL